MNYHAFSICLGSLHFPKDETDETWEKLSTSSIDLLNSLYQELSVKMASSRSPQHMAVMLEGSLFCCCLEEGMAMLKCSTDTLNRSIQLNGFVVMNESLRTAWRMVRWKLLFVCAVGWNRKGVNYLLIEEIDRIALSLQASPEYQKKLVLVSQEMLSAETPFSFAMTDFPLKYLPLTFRTTAISNLQTDFSNDVNMITISENFVQQKIQQYSSEMGGFFPNLFLQYGSKKQYYHQRISAIGEHEEMKKLKSDLKEQLKAYPYDEIWYFVVKNETFPFMNPLSTNAMNQIFHHGWLPFSELRMEMNQFVILMETFLKNSQKERDEKQKQDSSLEKKPEKKRHLFDFVKKDKKS